MSTSDGKTKKKEVSVNIILLDGTTIECCFFAAEGQRLLEVMNDDRTYIPYTDPNGQVTIIRKSTIARILPIEQNIGKISAKLALIDS